MSARKRRPRSGSNRGSCLMSLDAGATKKDKTTLGI